MKVDVGSFRWQIQIHEESVYRCGPVHGEMVPPTRYLLVTENWVQGRTAFLVQVIEGREKRIGFVIVFERGTKVDVRSF